MLWSRGENAVLGIGLCLSLLLLPQARCDFTNCRTLC